MSGRWGRSGQQMTEYAIMVGVAITASVVMQRFVNAHLNGGLRAVSQRILGSGGPDAGGSMDASSQAAADQRASSGKVTATTQSTLSGSSSSGFVLAQAYSPYIGLVLTNPRSSASAMLGGIAEVLVSQDQDAGWEVDEDSVEVDMLASGEFSVSFSEKKKRRYNLGEQHPIKRQRVFKYRVADMGFRNGIWYAKLVASESVEGAPAELYAFAIPDGESRRAAQSAEGEILDIEGALIRDELAALEDELQTDIELINRLLKSIEENEQSGKQIEALSQEIFSDNAIAGMKETRELAKDVLDRLQHQDLGTLELDELESLQEDVRKALQEPTTGSEGKRVQVRSRIKSAASLAYGTLYEAGDKEADGMFVLPEVLNGTPLSIGDQWIIASRNASADGTSVRHREDLEREAGENYFVDSGRLWDLLRDDPSQIADGVRDDINELEDTGVRLEHRAEILALLDQAEGEAEKFIEEYGDDFGYPGRLPDDFVEKERSHAESVGGRLDQARELARKDLEEALRSDSRLSDSDQEQLDHRFMQTSSAGRVVMESVLGKEIPGAADAIKEELADAEAEKGIQFAHRTEILRLVGEAEEAVAADGGAWGAGWDKAQERVVLAGEKLHRASELAQQDLRDALNLDPSSSPSGSDSTPENPESFSERVLGHAQEQLAPSGSITAVEHADHTTPAGEPLTWDQDVLPDYQKRSDTSYQKLTWYVLPADAEAPVSFGGDALGRPEVEELPIRPVTGMELLEAGRSTALNSDGTLQDPLFQYDPRTENPPIFVPGEGTLESDGRQPPQGPVTFDASGLLNSGANSGAATLGTAPSKGDAGLNAGDSIPGQRFQ